jgi:hypothetical protein
MAHTRSAVATSRVRAIAFGCVAVAVLCLLLTSALLLLFHQQSGDQMIQSGSTEDIREAVKIILDQYNGAITLTTTSFGAIAFLITLQKEKAPAVSLRVWQSVFASIALLVFALLASIIGREQIMMMVTHNAVDLNLPTLTLLRWISYVFLMLAAVIIMFFAFEVTLAPTECKEPERV